MRQIVRGRYRCACRTVKFLISFAAHPCAHTSGGRASSATTIVHCSLSTEDTLVLVTADAANRYIRSHLVLTNESRQLIILTVYIDLFSRSTGWAGLINEY